MYLLYYTLKSCILQLLSFQPIKVKAEAKKHVFQSAGELVEEAMREYVTPDPGGGGISGMNLVQVCRRASSYPPYKCILEYGKKYTYKCTYHHGG